VADDQRRQMRGKVSPVRGRRRPCLGVHLPAPPGTWQPTMRWGCLGGSTRQRSWGQGWGRRFCGVAAAAIMPGGIRQRHRRPDSGRHGPGPAPVRGMARQPPAPRGHDKGCHPQPAAAGLLSQLWPGGASCYAMAWHRGAHNTMTASRDRLCVLIILLKGVVVVAVVVCQGIINLEEP
jgi:hypothetical protein